MKVWVKQKGFTIVELLLVVIIIGILSTIVVVAYRSLSQRATSAQYNAAATQWEKLIRMQYAEVGSLPTTSGWVCLGKTVADYPAVTGFANGLCSNGLSISWNQTVMDAFSSTVRQSFLSLKGIGEVSGNRGIVYWAPLPNYAELAWWTPDKTGCVHATDDWSGVFPDYAQCHMYIDYR